MEALVCTNDIEKDIFFAQIYHHTLRQYQWKAIAFQYIVTYTPVGKQWLQVMVLWTMAAAR